MKGREVVRKEGREKEGCREGGRKGGRERDVYCKDCFIETRNT